MTPLAQLPLGQQFAQALPAMALPWRPAAWPAPALLVGNEGLAQSLGIDQIGRAHV